MSNFIANTLLPTTLDRPIPPQILEAMSWYFQNFMPVMLQLNDPSVENGKRYELNQEKVEAFLNSLYVKNGILSEASLFKMRDTLPNLPESLKNELLGYFLSPTRMLEAVKLKRGQSAIEQKLNTELADLLKANKTSGKKFATNLGKLFYFVNTIYDPQNIPVLDKKHMLPRATQQVSTPQESTPQVSTPQVSTPQASTPQASTPQQSTPQESTPQASSTQDTEVVAQASQTGTPNNRSENDKPQTQRQAEEKKIKEQSAVMFGKKESFIEKNKGSILIGIGAVFTVGTIAALIYRSKRTKKKKK